MPYTDEDIANAKDDMKAQADPTADHAAAVKRYPKANIVSGDGRVVTEMDALVAYLQVLGTMVDFSNVTSEQTRQ